MILQTQRVLAALLLLATAAHAADGDPDPTFSDDGQALSQWPYQFFGERVAVGPDGSVFHGSTEVRGVEFNDDFAVVKFRADGHLDTTFGFNGSRSVGFDLIEDGDDVLFGVFPLPAGKVLIAGTAQNTDDAMGYAPPALVLLLADGDVDPTFGDAGRRVITTSPFSTEFAGRITQAIRLNDGKILFGGICRDCAAEPQHVVMLLRVTAAGDPDPTFGGDGWATVSLPDQAEVRSLVVDWSGRIVIAGEMENEEDATEFPYAARLLPSGAFDPSFGAGAGYVVFSNLPDILNGWDPNALAVDRDGSMLLAIDNQNGAGIIRADADGNLDTSFADNGYLDLYREDGTGIEALAIRSDHRIVAAGRIKHTGGGRDFFVARALPDGTLDPDFDNNGVIRIDMGSGDDDSAHAIALSGGRPVVAGISGPDRDTAAVLRLQSDLIFTDGVE